MPANVLGGHKKTLAGLGRDPEAFTFALHHIVFVLEDKDEFERYVDNPLLKWYAATGGRINQNDWDPEGLEPVMPRDWHYAFHMKPNSLSLDQIMDVVDRTPHDNVRKTYFHGTPEDIARQIRSFVAVGANLHLIATWPAAGAHRAGEDDRALRRDLPPGETGRLTTRLTQTVCRPRRPCAARLRSA